MSRPSILLCVLASAGLASADARKPPASPPALYANVFRDGTTWRFKVEMVFSGNKRTTQRTTVDMKCTVDAVAHGAGEWRSRVGCDAEWPFQGSLAVGLDGGYTSNGAGLLLDFGANENFRLPASPAAKVHRVKNEEHSEAYTIEAFRGGWCIGHTTTHVAGVTYGKTVCFRGGDIVGGKVFSNPVGNTENKQALWGDVPR